MLDTPAIPYLALERVISQYLKLAQDTLTVRTGKLPASTSLI